MPTLLRFLTILALLVGAGYAGMAALAYLVEPQPREMTITIPPERLQPRR